MVFVMLDRVKALKIEIAAFAYRPTTVVGT